jgi:hypothetical protein
LEVLDGVVVRDGCYLLRLGLGPGGDDVEVSATGAGVLPCGGGGCQQQREEARGPEC